VTDEKLPHEPQGKGPHPGRADDSEHQFADNFGRSVGRLARAAREAARAAQPEVERLAHQARDATEAALPHVQRASREAASRASRFLRDHDGEIQQAAKTGAQLAASHSAPILRPVIFAAADEITRQAGSWAARPEHTPDEPATPASEAPESNPPEQKRPNLY
jgi:hypothetical protein